LAAAVVELVRDDPVRPVGVGQIVGVAPVRRGLPLLLLGWDGAERGLVHRLAVRRVRVSAGVVAGPRSVAVPVLAVLGNAVETRPEEDREQEPDERQGRDEGDELLRCQGITP
jgi:hypothetical protein